MDTLAVTKRYVGDDRFGVRLFEAIAQETRRVLQSLDSKDIKAAASWSDDEFRRRVGVYDEAFGGLCQLEAVVGRWGRSGAADLLAQPVKRTSDRLEQGGLNGWLRLQWYPALLLFYSGGIGAVTAGRFDVLVALMHAPVRKAEGYHEKLVSALTDGMGDGTQSFKLLPGLQQKRVPFSEHLYDVLRQLLEDVLYLGSDFDLSFDTFEILRAIQYAHLSGRGWGPIGRFGWRIQEHRNVWQKMVSDIEAVGDSWPPLQAGLCGRSRERLEEIMKQLHQAMSRAAWGW
jgi:hypothetical protein